MIGKLIARKEHRRSEGLLGVMEIIELGQEGLRITRGGKRYWEGRMEDVVAFSFHHMLMSFGGGFQYRHQFLSFWVTDQKGKDLEIRIEVVAEPPHRKFLGMPLTRPKSKAEIDPVLLAIKAEFENACLDRMRRILKVRGEVPWGQQVMIYQDSIKLGETTITFNDEFRLEVVEGEYAVHSSGPTSVAYDLPDSVISRSVLKQGSKIIEVRVGELNYFPGLRLLKELVESQR